MCLLTSVYHSFSMCWATSTAIRIACTNGNGRGLFVAHSRQHIGYLPVRSAVSLLLTSIYNKNAAIAALSFRPTTGYVNVAASYL